MEDNFAGIAQLANSEIARDGYEQAQQQQQDAPVANGKKRKAEDGQPQQRSKRNRYISIACDECKRRKIKCNGQTPCQRCGNLNLECVYAPKCCSGFKDTAEYKEMAGHISSLQDQVNGLYQELLDLRAQLGQGAPTQQQQQEQQQQQQPAAPMRGTHIDPSLQPSPFPSHRPAYAPADGQSTFRGPTSNSFNFGVARNSLQTMGIADGENGDSGEATREQSPAMSPSMQRISAQLVQGTHAEKDPIWSVSKEEALRLCNVYEDEMGLMYPVLDINQVIQYSQKLYRFMEAAHRSGLMQQGMPGADSIEDEDTNILKLVLATAMTTEAAGRSELGQRMFEYVQPAADNLLLGQVGIKGIRLLTLTAMYEFQRDNEGIAWRIIGHTVRLVIELGLHRRETYEAMQDENDRAEASLLFWAIYVLDRRWSFGTGMPFALQDSDIDPQVPKPGDRSPYLSAMIDYCAIAARVWRAVASTTLPADGLPVKTEDMDYLDYQIIQWHKNLPQSLRFEHPSQRKGRSAASTNQTRAGRRLPMVLYLRANQMRILIHRATLHSATSIVQNRKQAQVAIDVAKDTIRVLTHINTTTDLYPSHQMLFNPFLTSALAVLFLAVAHMPALYASQVREEFHLALDIVRGFSRGSWVGRRLWKCIRGLKHVGPKLGLGDAPAAQGSGKTEVETEVDPNRSAAVAMAGLAGHAVDEMALMEGTGGGGSGGGHRRGWSGATDTSRGSPERMANDLTSLFEAAQAFEAMGQGGTKGEGGSGGGEEALYGAGDGHGGPVETMAQVYGGEEELSSILRELF